MNPIKKIQVIRTKHRIRYLKAVNKAMTRAIKDYTKTLAKTPPKERWLMKNVAEFFTERYEPFSFGEPAKPYQMDKPYQARHLIKKQEEELKLQEAKLGAVI
jgi:hypothetical protein